MLKTVTARLYLQLFRDLHKLNFKLMCSNMFLGKRR